MSFSRAISVVAALALAGCSLFSVPKTPTTPPVLDPDLVQRGAILFADSRLSGDGSRACATCHPGGGSDHNVYRDGALVPPYTEGGRRTLTLRGMWQTAPYLWDDSAPTVAGAVDRMLAVEMNGGSLAGRDRDALETYLLSLTPFDRGRIQPDGEVVEPSTLAARRGSAVFARVCAECHVPPAFMQPRRADMGTGEWAVPTLRGVSVSGPYGHDGRWADLETVTRSMADHQEAHLSADELAQLLAYLQLL
jgi:Di-haem cytochrome c peroxidase